MKYLLICLTILPNIAFSMMQETEEPDPELEYLIGKTREGDERAVKQLLESDEKYFAALARRSLDGWYPIHYFAEKGFQDIIETLNKKDPSQLTLLTRKLSNILHMAASEGHRDLALFICEKHPTLISQENKNKWTPFLYAVLQGQLSVIECILTISCDQLSHKIDDSNALHILIESDQIISSDTEAEIARYLCEREPNLLKEKNAEGLLPFALAVEAGKIHIAREFYMKDSNVLFDVFPDKHPVLTRHIFFNSTTFASFIFENIEDLKHKKDARRRMLIHIFSSWGNLELVKYFCENDPMAHEAQDKGGWTPLHFAANNDQVPVVKYLSETYPALLSIRSKKGAIAFQSAAFFNGINAIRFLYFFDRRQIRTKTTNGHSVVETAVRQNHHELALFFCHVWPEIVFEKNDNGENLADLAINIGANDMVNFLRRNYKEFSH